MDIHSLQDFVMLAADRPVADSRKVGRQFGKRNDNVLRSIAAAFHDAPDEDVKLNFEVFLEISELQNGKPQKYYLLTKDAFMAVALAFTGKRAAKVRWDFIRAFNRMAEFIQRNVMGAWGRYNAALLEYRHDAATALKAASVLCAWGKGGRKAGHVVLLEQLNPQIQLLLTAELA